MGTHISRVKSVDLDAWTDEQLQSVLRWGNSRANKSVTTLSWFSGYSTRLTTARYWEAKLAAGHVPSETYACLDRLLSTEMLMPEVQKDRKFHSYQI